MEKIKGQHGEKSQKEIRSVCERKEGRRCERRRRRWWWWSHLQILEDKVRREEEKVETNVLNSK